MESGAYIAIFIADDSNEAVQMSCYFLRYGDENHTS